MRDELFSPSHTLFDCPHHHSTSSALRIQLKGLTACVGHSTDPLNMFLPTESLSRLLILDQEIHTQ
jgi:hypothetical protein